jgi:hypothetical protein
VRRPRETAPAEGYMRPQQAWQCGLSDDHPPCALGPLGWGRCPASAACHPLREGDRWVCNRSPLRGGPCEHGPGHDGACPVVHRCAPVRSLRGRRGRMLVGALAAAVGAALMALSGSWRNEIIVPGPLSAHHAHLVDGANPSSRCAQCHPGGNNSATAWLGFSSSDESASATPGASQSTLCMACHEKSFSRELALAAHNMPLAELRAAAGGTTVTAKWGGPRRDAAEPIACSACHQEHHGRMHDLAAISDAACQACHRQEFASFAQDHPDFGNWPYERRTRIVFDHASHQAKHHPAQKQAFACADCHQADTSGAWQLTRNYAASCAGCHDKGLGVSLAGGVSLVALPTLDLAALADAGHAVERWPADADGDFDGALPVVLQLLVAAKPEGAAALAELGPQFDFFDVDPDDETQVAAAAVVANELRTLIDDLSNGAQAAIATRLGAVLGRELAEAELDALTARLAPEAIGAYRDRWFGADAPDDDSEESSDESVGGSWSRDEATFSLRYHPIGHADPWMTAWLNTLAEAAAGPSAAIAEPLLRSALAPTAAGQCGSCHSVERDDAGRLAIQWRPFDPQRERRGPTHFSHAAHVLQSQLADCAACHRIVPGTSPPAPYASDDPRQFVAGFASMAKATCVACHTAGAAGDACTQCHRYHSGRSGPWAVGSGQ